MAKLPKADLGSMAISKATAADTAPFAAPIPTAVPAMASAGPTKSLTVKLDGDLYADLRTYCYEHEKASGVRLTHQEVMVSALRAKLAAPRE